MINRAEDPLLTSARREATCVVLVWLAALGYSVTYCVRYGYGRPLADLKFVWGFPAWVFWGIIVPWAVCLSFSCWFALGFMKDGPLEDEAEASDLDDPLAPPVAREGDHV